MILKVNPFCYNVWLIFFIKETHSQLAREIILKVGTYIQNVLEVPKESVVSTENQKEQYKIYGLLLSACVLKQHTLKERSSSIIDKVITFKSNLHLVINMLFRS